MKLLRKLIITYAFNGIRLVSFWVSWDQAALFGDETCLATDDQISYCQSFRENFRPVGLYHIESPRRSYALTAKSESLRDGFSPCKRE